MDESTNQIRKISRTLGNREVQRQSSSAVQRVDAAKLYVIVDTKLARGPIPKLAQSIAKAGANILQLRCRNIPDREQVNLATEMVRAVRDVSSALVIINNRADIALEAGADGVHVGMRDLPIPACRRILGREAIVGFTTHQAREAAQAVCEGVDYISYGPFYATPLKPRLAPRGDSYLDAVKRLEIPFFAIGGIGPSSIKALRRKGIERIAVCSAVLLAPHPAKAVRNLKRLLEL